MKKLLFVLAFTFIGQQAFSQMYIVTYTDAAPSHPSSCDPDDVLTKISPTGNVTYTCIHPEVLYADPSPLVTINQELNNIINQGYKLIETNSPQSATSQDWANGSTISAEQRVTRGTIYYFAIP
jgi:hypothetical protein